MVEVSVDNVAQYLRARRLLGAGPATVSALGGGVSSRVLLVEQDELRLVVKQTLPRFNVKAEWLVDVGRASVEAAFLEHVGPRLASGTTPRILLYDEESHLVVMGAAPRSFRAWKERVLGGTWDEGLVAKAATLLASIHGTGLEQPGLRRRFDQPRLFDQQRIDSYLRATLATHRGLAGSIVPLVARLEKDRTTLIHGDFSPKNMLTDGTDVVLVDHEVATWNDPLFDVSFFVNHLLLKAVHVPVLSERLVAGATRFLASYGSASAPALRGRAKEPSHLLPALLLARVDGKSPVEYLVDGERRFVRETAIEWLRGDPWSVADYASAWRAAIKAAPPASSSVRGGSSG